MCPLRFILVFFSAVLAGYFAWQSISSAPPEVDLSMISEEDSTTQEKKKTPSKDNQETDLIKMIQDGFWVFVDMASGRYLWRNMKEMKKKHHHEKVNS